MFRPLAQTLVPPLARANVNPAHVVLLHTVIGLDAAARIRRGERLAPALLLQLKTVLDGLDGQLARATGRTTETGRYLDTEMDLVVNAALNVAIEGVPAGLALTVLQSVILTVDYLWEREHREARGEVFRDPPAQAGDDPRVLAALRAVYAAYFVPQERVLGRVFAARLRRVAGGAPSARQRQAYTPLAAATVTANLGLSTQFLALGLAVLTGRPQLYTRSLPLQAALLLGTQLWREARVRAATAGPQPSSSG
ncbi:phosphatidylglycerophosphate synthase [Deinococcus metalli]|uniref:CDP-alcohol phosphatidyltransferase n=1 Tax=Deinococcus metalli TaxID=1141878 RepID=A0A7W8NR66_9DEIO|nr:CDP-alcohol phosphatidyltransferase family protein [Deinococcus metalli]MBB5377585.1 phosphatidylglycerophosphate synthase [Deinococcus metalli]GHF51880.1 CDP-alcohol phosphatidyltransferase [Deinococcus metalli]